MHPLNQWKREKNVVMINLGIAYKILCFIIIMMLLKEVAIFIGHCSMIGTQTGKVVNYSVRSKTCRKCNGPGESLGED